MAHATRDTRISGLRLGARFLLAHAVALVSLLSSSTTPAAAFDWRYRGDNILAVARHSSATGAPDAAFQAPASPGQTTTDVAMSSLEQVLAVAPYPGGRTVAAGCAVIAGVQKFIVVRYAANGRLDTTFNGTGRAVIYGASGCAKAIAVQADGKVVVAGSTAGNAGQVIEVRRLTAQGSYDATFNRHATQGYVRVMFPEASAQAARAVALQADGKILIVGEATVNGGNQFALARLTAEGGLDRGFGDAGLQLTDFISGTESAAAAVLQADGRILVGGWADAQLALARYLPSGRLDASFGGGTGVVFTDLGKTLWEGIRAIRVTKNNGIVVAGYGYSTSLASMLIAVRHGANGTVERTHVSEFISSTGEPWTINAVAIASNGKIFAAGEGSRHDQGVIAAYNSDATDDFAFGSEGAVVTTFTHPRGPARAWFNALSVDPSTGTVITGGSVAVDTDPTDSE